MAWPKKDTRKIHLGAETFLWHLSGNNIECGKCVITIGKSDGRFVLHLDPFVWDTPIAPSTIREVILWAKTEGWSAELGPTRGLAYSAEAENYIWLPDGIRYLHQLENK